MRLVKWKFCVRPLSERFKIKICCYTHVLLRASTACDELSEREIERERKTLIMGICMCIWVICHWVQTFQFIIVRCLSRCHLPTLLAMTSSFGLASDTKFNKNEYMGVFLFRALFSFLYSFSIIFISQCQLVTRYSYVHWYCARSLTSSCCHHHTHHILHIW